MCKRISSAAATTEMAKAVSTTSSSSQGSSVICEEVFDEACFPSSEGKFPSIVIIIIPLTIWVCECIVISIFSGKIYPGPEIIYILRTSLVTSFNSF